MAKVTLEGSAFLAPVPVMLLSCCDQEGTPNLMAVSWVSVACQTPAMVSVAMRTDRASYAKIQETGEFVLNMPPASLVRAADLCGTVSGAQEDKFSRARLTPIPGDKVRPPLVKECPVNLECVVRQCIPLGTHELFVAEVVAVHADEDVVEDGLIVLGRVAPFVFDPFGGDYWRLADVIAHHGFSEGSVPEPQKASAPRKIQKQI
jgi:flavin reductase (DIM6/NTAB) family NADH-FMN oxidoreductase RutF